MKFVSVLFAGLFALAACSSTPTTPYVSVPLADLAVGTPLIVHGKGMGWTENNSASGFTVNEEGPRLQKFDVTATTNPDDVYVALFKDFVTQISYGTATFTMPASMGTVSGVTDLGYAFTIQRNNENLVYTLSGIYTVALFANTSGGLESGGGFATGSSTGDAALPTSGAADYAGNFLGQSTFDGIVTGTATMHVEFGEPTSQITGLITNLVSEGLSSTTYVFTDLTIEATFLPGAAYDGIVRANTSATNNAFSFGTTGKIAGGFYGPNAEEFGAAVRITDNNGHILSGAISGTVVP